MSKNRIPGRQGDVLFVREDDLKVGAEVLPENGRLILATGETSGHCHVIDAAGAKLYELAQSDVSVDGAVDRMLEVLAKSEVRVESTTSRNRLDDRHPPIELPPGEYRVRIMHEFHQHMIRRVED